MSNVPHRSSWLGLHGSRGVILRLSALFALDAFGGGFILQSIVAYWFYLRFHLNPATGNIFFSQTCGCGVGIRSAGLAKRFGLINTMVFTHLPSNVLLLLVPPMPNLTLAVALLLARFSISQMDVPTRQSIRWQWSVRMNDLPHRGSRRLPGPSAQHCHQPSPVIAWQIPIWSTCRFYRRGVKIVTIFASIGIRVTRAWRQRLGPESDI